VLENRDTNVAPQKLPANQSYDRVAKQPGLQSIQDTIQATEFEFFPNNIGTINVNRNKIIGEHSIFMSCSRRATIAATNYNYKWNI
jgi:hypothetical protein